MIVLNPSHTAVLVKNNEVTALCVFSRKDTVHFLPSAIHKQPLFYSALQTNIRRLKSLLSAIFKIYNCKTQARAATNGEYEFCGNDPFFNSPLVSKKHK